MRPALQLGAIALFVVGCATDASAPEAARAPVGEETQPIAPGGFGGQPLEAPRVRDVAGIEPSAEERYSHLTPDEDGWLIHHSEEGSYGVRSLDAVPSRDSADITGARSAELVDVPPEPNSVGGYGSQPLP